MQDIETAELRQWHNGPSYHQALLPLLMYFGLGLDMNTQLVKPLELEMERYRVKYMDFDPTENIFVSIPRTWKRRNHFWNDESYTGAYETY